MSGSLTISAKLEGVGTGAAGGFAWVGASTSRSMTVCASSRLLLADRALKLPDLVRDGAHRRQRGVGVLVELHLVLALQYQHHRGQVHAVDAQFLDQVARHVEGVGRDILQLQFLDQNLSDAPFHLANLRLRHLVLTTVKTSPAV